MIVDIIIHISENLVPKDNTYILSSYLVYIYINQNYIVYFHYIGYDYLKWLKSS